MARASLGSTPAHLAALVLVLILAGCTPASFVPRDSGGGGGGQGGGSEAGQDPDGGEGDDAGPADGANEAAPDIDAGNDSPSWDVVADDGGADGGVDVPADVPDDTSSDASADLLLDAILDASADASSDTDGQTANDGAVVGVSPTVAGQLVISEIMMDTATITDDDGEWFEIHNPSTTVTYDLEGCILSGGGQDTISQSLIVAPGAFISLARNGDPNMVGFVPTYSYGPTLKFNNSAGSATLICGPGATTIIDTVTYTVDEVVKGSSFTLSPAHYDAAENDVPANWCHCMIPYRMTSSDTDYGTPGMPNPPCP